MYAQDNNSLPVWSIFCHQLTNSYLHQFSAIFGGNCITIDEDVTKPPTHLQVVEWCCNSFRELEGTIVCNAWLNGRFSYFPVTSKETIDVDDCEDDEEPEYIDVAPQDGDVYHLVVDSDVNIDYNDVVEAEEV